MAEIVHSAYSLIVPAALSDPPELLPCGMIPVGVEKSGCVATAAVTEMKCEALQLNHDQRVEEDIIFQINETSCD